MSHATSTQLQVWIDRLQVGDPAARAALIAHACDRLRALTRALRRDFRRLRNWEETDDVLQNAVVRLLRALEAAPPASVTEFFRLAAQQIRRELLDLSRHYFGPHGPALRQTPLGQDSSNGGAAVEPSDHTHDPGRLALWSEFHQQVEALPAEERDLFDLVWYQGLPLKEAAEVLGVSYATVKRRWLAARVRLGQFLDLDSGGVVQ